MPTVNDGAHVIHEDPAAGTIAAGVRVNPEARLP
jgi:hypothetical protein